MTFFLLNCDQTHHPMVASTRLKKLSVLNCQRSYLKEIQYLGHVNLNCNKITMAFYFTGASRSMASANKNNYDLFIHYLLMNVIKQIYVRNHP